MLIVGQNVPYAFSWIGGAPIKVPLSDQWPDRIKIVTDYYGLLDELRRRKKTRRATAVCKDVEELVKVQSPATGRRSPSP